MSPKPETSEVESAAGTPATPTGIDPEAQRMHDEAEAKAVQQTEEELSEVLEAQQEAGIKHGPNSSVEGVTYGKEPAGAEYSKKVDEGVEAARKRRPSLEPAKDDQTLAAQLYRGTIPKNGAHGMKLSAEDEKQLRNVDVKGNTTSVTFNTGLQVNLSPKIKEASGFASDADRKRAARMIVDQSMREGNKRKVFIHSYDLQGGPFQFKQRGDRRFAMELYKEAKRQGAKVSVCNMSALDTIRARMQLREEKKNGAGSEHGPAQAFEDPKQPANDDIKMDPDDKRVSGLNGKMSQSPDPAVEAIKANTEQLKALKDLLNGGGRSVNGNNNVAATGDGANAIKGDNNHIGDRHNHFHGDVHVHVDARSLGGLGGLSGLGGGMPGGHDSGGGADFVSGVAEKMHGRRHDAMVAGFIEGKEVKRIGHDSGPRRIEGPDTPRLTGPDDGGSSGQKALPSAERKALPAPPKALPAPPKALPPPKGM